MKLASILNHTDILSDNPVTTETDLSESKGPSSDTAHSYKTCTNIEFDYSKSMWTDGLFMDRLNSDIKMSTGFPENPILACNCVGRTNMRRCLRMKVCLIAIHNCPVILGCF